MGKRVAALVAIEGRSPRLAPPPAAPSSPGPDVGNENHSDILALFNTLNKRAMEAYTTNAFPGKIALFYAKKSKLNKPGYFQRWRKFGENGIECFGFPGGHTDLFRPPAVQELTKRLQDYLDASRKS